MKLRKHERNRTWTATSTAVTGLLAAAALYVAVTALPELIRYLRIRRM